MGRLDEEECLDAYAWQCVIGSKEPYISTKDPYVSAKKPYKLRIIKRISYIYI